MEIEIFNEGFTNEINPMSPMELECIYQMSKNQTQQLKIMNFI